MSSESSSDRLTPLQRELLAWVLSQIVVPDGASLPAGVSPAELRAYLVGLKARLLRASAPQ